jgi:hypothetical protein
MRKWPFPGDIPLIRARKVALAYRNLALEHEQAVAVVRDVLEKFDRRLIAFDNPGSVSELDKALQVIEATTVKNLDDRFTEWGETWHAEQPDHYEPHEWVKGSVAAQLLHTSTKQISALRIAGRLKGKWDRDMNTNGGYWYRVGDLYELSMKKRGRTSRTEGSADTLTDSGSSDTK